MLIELFFKTFAKKLVIYVPSIQAVFQTINASSGGTLTLATPYVIALSGALAFAQTISSAMGVYEEEISVMEERLKRLQ
jgi:hypothetical protein